MSGEKCDSENSCQSCGSAQKCSQTEKEAHEASSQQNQKVPHPLPATRQGSDEDGGCDVA